MERHAGLKHGGVAGADTDVSLAPIGRIAQANAVTGAAFLVVAVRAKFSNERGVHVFTGVAGFGRGDARVDRGDQCRFGIEPFATGCAKEDGSAQRHVIALVHTRDFEERAEPGLKRLVVPGEVRCGRVDAGGGEGHDGWVVATMFGRAGDARVVDLGNEVVLAHANFHAFENAGVHVLDDRARNAHVGNLLVRLHRPLPVH